MKDRLYFSVLSVLLAASLLFLVINISTSWSFLRISVDGAPLFEPIQQCWLTYCWDGTPTGFSWTLYALLAQNIYATLFFLMLIFRSPLHSRFHNTFLTIFVITILFQSSRLLQLMTISRDAAQVLGMTITRLTLFAHLLGSAMLFMASIAVLTRLRKNRPLVISICAIISFGIAYRIPIDQFIYYPNLTNNIGRLFEVQIIIAIIQFFTIFNALVKYIYNRNRSTKLFLWALILLVVATQNTLYLISPFLILIGLLSLIIGSMLYMRAFRLYSARH